MFSTARSLLLAAFACTFVGAMAFTNATFAQKAQGYKVGDAVADFSLKSTDGKSVAMADYPAAKGFIVVFTCNHCPFAKAYEQRILDLDKRFAAKGYPVIAINPNDPAVVDEDSPANMQARAKEKGYTFPYLFDDGQKVFPRFGATKTPHVYVVSAKGKGDARAYTVEYIGAIDDNSDEPKKATKHYVSDAVEALLAGKKVAITNTKAVGCGIKVASK